MQIIDSHTHLDFSEFDSDRSAVIQQAVDVGISDIIISATTAERWHLIKKICNDNHTLCHAAYGLHPMFLAEHKLTDNHNDLDKLKTCLEDNKSIAIGEIGLDFFIDEVDENHKKTQIDLFISQLEIASEFELPVIIHARKSIDIILKHLRQFPSITGSIHSFSGSEQQAKQLIDLGFYLSFGGPITYSRATRLHKLIQQLPLKSLLVETDSPDQPDTDNYGSRNEPSYIVQVIDKIAELKEIDVALVAQETTSNAKNLFGF